MSMRIVIEHSEDGVFVMLESNNRYRENAKHRTNLELVPVARLDNECRIAVGEYVAVEIKPEIAKKITEARRKRRPKAKIIPNRGGK